MNLDPEETVLDKHKPLRVITVRCSVELHERIKGRVSDLNMQREFGEPHVSINQFCVNAILDALTADVRSRMEMDGE